MASRRARTPAVAVLAAALIVLGAPWAPVAAQPESDRVGEEAGVEPPPPADEPAPAQPADAAAPPQAPAEQPEPEPVREEAPAPEPPAADPAEASPSRGSTRSPAGRDREPAPDPGEEPAPDPGLEQPDLGEPAPDPGLEQPDLGLGEPAPYPGLDDPATDHGVSDGAAGHDPVIVDPLDPSTGEIAPAAPSSEVDRGQAIRIILGLVVIFVLAYLAGDPRVQQLERRLRVSGVITSGLPFVFIGVVASQPGIDVLNEPVLDQIRPFLPFGLGWIGFIIGVRFDLLRIVRLPRGVGVSALLTGLLPLATISGAAAAMLLITDGFTTDAIFLRNALLLGVAGLLGVRAARIRSEGIEVDRLAPLAQVQELIAIGCLLVVAAFFRPVAEVGWQMPPIAWLFVTVGLGALLGAMIYVILSQFEQGPEVSLLMLGTIALAAGLASYLRLSPIVVCFIAAAMVGNFPGAWKEGVIGALLRLERPIYLVFLVVAGALWRLGDWQGWLLMALFVLARFSGRWFGTEVVRRQLPDQLAHSERRRLVLAPVDALAVAIIVNAQDLYSGPMIPWLVTAVIGGAIATEIVVQMAARGEEPVEARVSHVARVAWARMPTPSPAEASGTAPTATALGPGRSGAGAGKDEGTGPSETSGGNDDERSPSAPAAGNDEDATPPASRGDDEEGW